jgi:hypothetical protein
MKATCLSGARGGGGGKSAPFGPTFYNVHKFLTAWFLSCYDRSIFQQEYS